MRSTNKCPQKSDVEKRLESVAPAVFEMKLLFKDLLGLLPSSLCGGLSLDMSGLVLLLISTKLSVPGS